MSGGSIYNAVRASHSLGIHQISPTQSAFSRSTINSITKSDLRDATRHRRGFAIFTSVLFGITTIFLLILQIGNVSNTRVLGDLFMFRIDVSNIIPSSGPSTNTQNTAARSLGLHDFYQVGLWNFCEGYNDIGITACSTPSVMFWFNPVQLIQDELLAGATGRST